MLHSAAGTRIDAAPIARDAALHQLNACLELRFEAANPRTRLRVGAQDPPWRVIRAFEQAKGGRWCICIMCPEESSRETAFRCELRWALKPSHRSPRPEPRDSTGTEPVRPIPSSISRFQWPKALSSNTFRMRSFPLQDPGIHNARW